MPLHAADNSSNPLQIVTSQKGWLNTSRALSADDLKGRIVLLDFWTFCCINCIHIMPDLKYLEEKFGHDLTVIGVHSAKFKNEQDSENIRAAILRYGLEHPVVNDFDFSVWQRFGVRAWPTLVLINPDGLIENTYSGEGNRDALEHDIEALRKEYAGKLNTAPLPLALEKDKMPPAALAFPGKISVSPDSLGEPLIFLSDSGHHQVAQLLKDKLGSRIGFSRIGSGIEGYKDGPLDDAQFRRPQGLLYDSANHILYIADTENHVLRAADFNTHEVTTVAGTGQQGYEREAQNAPALQTPLASPWDLAFYPDNKHIVIAMAGTHQLWSYDIAAKTVSVIAGNGRESIDDGRYPKNSLSQPSGLSAHDGKLYFVDSETSSLRVFENGEIKTLIGTGLFDFGYKEGKQGEAKMQHAIGVHADASGVYIADSYNHSIRRYDPKTGILSNFAGHGERGKEDGAAAQASFNEPNDVQMINGRLYVADTNNNAIRVIENGKVTTLAIGATRKSEEAAYSTTLPNPTHPETTSVDAGVPVTVTLGLQKGWHINDEAPSYLALFEMPDGKPKHIATYPLEVVKKQRFTLPKLTKGSTYQLQGTLYFCEDKAGAECLITSFDRTVKAWEKSGDSILLKLN